MRRPRSSNVREALVQVVVALAQRNYMRMIVDHAAVVARAGPEAVHSAAAELDLALLFWEIDVVLGDAFVRSTCPLATVEADLDALANTFVPIEALKDERLRTWLEKLPLPRRQAKSTRHHPAWAQEQATALALLGSR